ncbi:hypothetical protein GCM10022223_65130 [Kineosporia mesophila]|uniref:Uncharacterized protein n=1 Tax=Kineosporia mesophila TaxID=566012 RepID=A0ABP7AQ47_9ACTN
MEDADQLVGQRGLPGPAGAVDGENRGGRGERAGAGLLEKADEQVDRLRTRPGIRPGIELGIGPAIRLGIGLAIGLGAGRHRADTTL